MNVKAKQYLHRNQDDESCDGSVSVVYAGGDSVTCFSISVCFGTLANRISERKHLQNVQEVTWLKEL